MQYTYLLAAVIAALAGGTAGTPTGQDIVARGRPLVTLCKQYGYHRDNGYEILNNLWGKDSATSGSQCTYYNGRVGTGVSFSSDWSWAGKPNDVKSFIYANRVFTRPLISNIKTLPTSAQWSYNASDIRANVAYDIFTHSDPNHANSGGDYEVMIWLHRYGGVWPITESRTGKPVTRVKIAGYSWDLYTGWNGRMRVYSFLSAQGSLNFFSADVMLFFNYLTKNYQFPASRQYMLIYQFGTEAYTGRSARFDVSRFQAEVTTKSGKTN
ncbi:hypothetical protein NLU13_3539 [Sarocladium strictum]|uniref:Uncharacterized protein n=1 Tax=Sarocladium strictum TaxID=5046 RepID=A0AA39GMX5_SARSR|nr:hypothetical protein NLU13_3539 [Sarocladium strictum]